MITTESNSNSKEVKALRIEPRPNPDKKSAILAGAVGGLVAGVGANQSRLEDSFGHNDGQLSTVSGTLKV